MGLILGGGGEVETQVKGGALSSLLARRTLGTDGERALKCGRSPITKIYP